MFMVFHILMPENVVGITSNVSIAKYLMFVIFGHYFLKDYMK